MTLRDSDRRLVQLEAAARRLLPPAPEPFDPVGWIGWLTNAELDDLALYVEQQGDVPEIDVPADLYRRALGRAVMGVEMDALREQERAGRRLLRLPHPDRPDDAMAVLYVPVTRDLVDPDVWRVDGWYVRTHGLPATMTTAEVEPVTAAAPWLSCLAPAPRG
jgi:hypothetical protein